MKTIGIIGFGSFGKFLAEQLDADSDVRVYSNSQKQNAWSRELHEVARADYILLAVPLAAYESVLNQLKPLLSKHSILVDVCSVKQESVKLIKKVLPTQQLVATHPLFGPQTADQLAGQTIVLCPEVSDRRALQEVEVLAKKFRLKIMYMSAKEHDQEMAVVQGLTFYIAHILKNMNLHEPVLNTPSFKRLLHLAELEAEHSEELFYTIQAGNPETQNVRKQFIKYALQLEEKIKAQNKSA